MTMRGTLPSPLRYFIHVPAGEVLAQEERDFALTLQLIVKFA